MAKGGGKATALDSGISDLTFSLNQLMTIIGSVIIMLLLFLVVCHILNGK